jgi:hypothetical protein
MPEPLLPGKPEIAEEQCFTVSISLLIPLSSLMKAGTVRLMAVTM